MMTEKPEEWTCGHVAGAVCAECYRILAAKANELQAELDGLREELRSLYPGRNP